MTPTLDSYLKRIGYRGTPKVDAATLTALHSAHLRAIAYENLDVQLGRPVGIDIEPIFEKLVLDQRGGWCYEMNGLFAWALETIGFPVTRLAAGVGRASDGDAVVGNHLALWVRLAEPWLADTGFGDGLLEPVAIRHGSFSQSGFEFALEPLRDGWWRFHNHPNGSASSFDFELSPGAPEIFERKSRFLQTSPSSPFTRVAVVQRHVADGLAMLRGRVLKFVGGTGGVRRRVIADKEEYRRVLRDVFDIEAPELDRLWDRVQDQHAAHVAGLSG